MKKEFSIYLQSSDRFYRYYKLQLKSTGLYVFNNTRNGDHFTYHDNGICFRHFLGIRREKKIRPPLNEFNDIESIACVNVIQWDNTTLLPTKPVVEDSDIVIARPAPFSFELILAKSPFELKRNSERLNTEVFQRQLGNLLITVQAFDNIRPNYLAPTTYHPNKWIPGHNFFSWIDDRWQ